MSQYGFHNFAPKSRYDEKGSNQVKVLDIWKNEMEFSLSNQHSMRKQNQGLILPLNDGIVITSKKHITKIAVRIILGSEMVLIP